MDELREEVIRLGPWHIDIEITPEISTRAFLDAPPGSYPEEFGRVNFHDPRQGFMRRLARLFPNGLEGRSVLDSACNCGAYLFYTKEAGAGPCLGFDVREHWISQARFLAEHRTKPSDDMRFEVANLYDLPALNAGRFDVSLFLGIFYHLPDPVTGLKMVADLTDELLVINTASKAGTPDGFLVPDRESPTKLMSGAYGLCWYPTGPMVLAAILNWLGFPEVRCSVWRHAPKQRKDLDRIEVLAARTPGFFDAWDAARPDGPAGLSELIESATPPGAAVLVASAEEGLAVEAAGRDVMTVGVQDLERRLADGAGFVVLTAPARDVLLEAPARLAGARIAADDRTGRVYALEDRR